MTFEDSRLLEEANALHDLLRLFDVSHVVLSHRDDGLRLSISGFDNATNLPVIRDYGVSESLGPLLGMAIDSCKLGPDPDYDAMPMEKLLELLPKHYSLVERNAGWCVEGARNADSVATSPRRALIQSLKLLA